MLNCFSDPFLHLFGYMSANVVFNQTIYFKEIPRILYLQFVQIIGCLHNFITHILQHFRSFYCLLYNHYCQKFLPLFYPSYQNDINHSVSGCEENNDRSVYNTINCHITVNITRCSLIPRVRGRANSVSRMGKRQFLV